MKVTTKTFQGWKDEDRLINQQALSQRRRRLLLGFIFNDSYNYRVRQHQMMILVHKTYSVTPFYAIIILIKLPGGNLVNTPRTTGTFLHFESLV